MQPGSETEYRRHDDHLSVLIRKSYTSVQASGNVRNAWTSFLLHKPAESPPERNRKRKWVKMDLFCSSSMDADRLLKAVTLEARKQKYRGKDEMDLVARKNDLASKPSLAVKFRHVHGSEGLASETLGGKA